MADHIMLEMLERERREKISTWELAMIAIGKLLGADVPGTKRVLQPLVESLTDEVSQRIYDIGYLRTRLIQRQEQVRKERNEKTAIVDERSRLMDKLVAMGQTDGPKNS